MRWREVRRWARNLVYRCPPPQAVQSLTSWIESPLSNGSLQILERGNQERQRTNRFVATLNNGRVFSNGVVLSPDGDTTFDDVYLDFGKDTLRSICGGPNLPRPSQFSGDLAVCATPGSERYFHFLFDALPRIELCGPQFPGTYYIQADRPFQREYLSLLKIEPSRVMAATKRALVQATNLIVPSYPGLVGYVTRRTCGYLRRLLNTVQADLQPSARIYVTRADAARRKVTNEAQIWTVLRRRGFERVRLADLSVVDQIQLFARSAVVVGPHGAGLSNLVYCSPGTRVLELFAPEYCNECFEMLASQVDLDYDCLVGAGERPQHKVARREKRNMHIDTAQLECMLDRILAGEPTPRPRATLEVAA